MNTIRTSALSLSAVAMACCLAILPQSARSQVIFEDTFNYGGVLALEPNLAVNQAARQAGGLVTSTYTKQFSVGNTSGLNAANGHEALLLRTLNPAAGSSQSAVDLDVNLAPYLAGGSYNIILDDVWFLRGSATITDAWLGISLGDTSPSVTGPTGLQADIGVLLRPRDNGQTIWRDNVNTGGVVNWTGSGLDYSFAARFNQIIISVDEVAGIVSGQVTTANGIFLLPSVPFSFENNTDRYLELRGHQGATGTDGQLVDVRIGKLSIVVPEPSSLAMLMAGGAVMILRANFRLGRIRGEKADTLRDIVWFIDPSHERLSDLVARMAETTQTMLVATPYTFTQSGDFRSASLPLDFRRNIMPIFKETLHNAIKHSKATGISIEVNRTKDVFQITVQDDGCGFDLTTRNAGNGLKNIRRRAVEMKAELAISSNPSQGTQKNSRRPSRDSVQCTAERGAAGTTSCPSGKAATSHRTPYHPLRYANFERHFQSDAISDGEIDITLLHMPSSEQTCKNEHHLRPG